MTRRPVKILVLRAVTWPLLVTLNVVARVWTLLGSTSRRRARRLAASDTARQARQDAEARLRAIADAYAGSTPLVLRLLVVEDHYTRGTASLDLFTSLRPAYRVSCWMRLTAYYSSPLPPAETITRILDAGEQALSGIPFTHDIAHEDSGELAHAGHTLTGISRARRFPSPNNRRTPTGSCASPRQRAWAVSAAGTARCSR
ncbi:hypothetical protein [Streptomyces aurantiogriseus]|uniref:Uncharacterized protein n=1 Tax=Streptomyces aurantiogriseus TaxID=66870 RepID=A0A918F8C6_9ACTN|nr:hypothetical protein [Streptomyces aurantiogriseus]GGR10027.1 hypothetical protein GCM10010251_27340 [Streptomyces aurantiogriseus]